ncbi:hypothetical protein [Sphingopyxis sp.]|uniref:hypothetical protein n=1 Tax=Sphingopyxis sp. TaxID=1908224 RepID=UPI003D6D2F63
MSHLIIALLVLGSGTEAPLPAAAPAADPVICKRFDETGSLARKRKVCKTKAEWSKSTSELQDTMNRFVEDRRGRPPSGN